MWTCSQCQQTFTRNNQSHSCNDRVIADFFRGKSAHVQALFHAFVEKFNSIGITTVHPTKSMIAFAAARRMAYLTRVGKAHIDITFIFDRPYEDNLCFHRIARVPGTDQYNHHFRMCSEEDLNEEVTAYMERVYRHHS